jgi:hypothetical protein
MNAMPLVSPEARSLADVVDTTLASARAGHPEPCLWCGGGPVRVTSVNIWTGEVSVLCPECGSELVGLAPRQPHEAAR